MRWILGVSHGVQINFGMTVPDAPVLLDRERFDCVLLDRGLRLFLFEDQSPIIGLYTSAAPPLADHPARVRLVVSPETLTIRSKQGIRLWPEMETYSLPSVPLGCWEPPQNVVKYEDGALEVPVSAGFAYRLAKAPAYVFGPAEMPRAKIRSILTPATPT